MRLCFWTAVAIIGLLSMWGCRSGDTRHPADLSHVEVDPVTIKQYGKAIFTLDTADLATQLKILKPEFPLFLDGDLDDPGTIQKMADFITDPKLIKAFNDCRAVYPDLVWLEKELTEVFRHYRYYFPGQPVPEVYTYVSGFDFEFKVQFYNTNLLIALDMYLGSDYPAYQQLGVPQYVIRRFDRSYITRDCAYEIARSALMYRKLGNHLIDFMINEGKLLWFVSQLNPEIPETILFDYTPEQMDWVRQNEGLVWAFMIENEALYSSNPDYMQKLIMEGPFTSYFGNEAPPRLGAYIGYQIVDSYMQAQKEETLSDLMQEYDPRTILKFSKYKPDY